MFTIIYTSYANVPKVIRSETWRALLTVLFWMKCFYFDLKNSGSDFHISKRLMTTGYK